MVDNEQVIAKSIERTDVAPDQGRRSIGGRAALLIEDSVAQTLGLADFFLLFGDTDFEIAGAEQ